MQLEESLTRSVVEGPARQDQTRWLLSSRADPDAAIYLVFEDPVAGLRVIQPNTVPLLVAAPEPVTDQPELVRMTLADGDLFGCLQLRPSQRCFRPPRTKDEDASEVKRLVHAVYDYAANLTRVTLQTPLDNVYARGRLSISANVVRASQGESMTREVIGSGNGSLANQSFELLRAPLTFLPAPPPVYRQTTLRVFVNDLRWLEVDSLSDAGPNAQVYAVSIDKQGRAKVHFGDGVHGSRLPTGTHNVVATYRVGVGSIGDVARGSLDVMLSPPPGVASVTNPIPALDGVDPESSSSIRAKLPRSARTVNRIVSLDDFSEVASCVPGVQGAIAERLRVNGRSLIAVTVAFDPRVPASEHEPRCRALDQSFAKLQIAPALPTRTVATEVVQFELTAKLTLSPGVVAADVVPRVFDAVYARWSAANAKLGEDVRTNEVMAAIQSVLGVQGLHLLVLSPINTGHDTVASLRAAPARFAEDGKGVEPAETLALDRAAARNAREPIHRGSTFIQGSVTMIVQGARG